MDNEMRFEGKLCPVYEHPEDGKGVLKHQRNGRENVAIMSFEQTPNHLSKISHQSCHRACVLRMMPSASSAPTNHS